MNKNKAQAIGNPLLLRIIRRVYPVLEKVIPKLAFKLSFILFFTPFKFKTPPREQEVLQKSIKFNQTINGKRTQFYSWGNEKQPLIILVHGWMGRASQFYKLVDALIVKNYHVVAFDGPAHGASGGRQTNVIDFSEAINCIANKYGSIACAIGHSFGGITILYAIEQGLEINNVVLVATPSIASDIIKQFEEKINASPATGENFRKGISQRYGVSFDTISASELIKKVSLKSLLLVHDENDNDVPLAHADLIKAQFPAAKTIYTKGLGHTRILRNETVIEKIALAIGATLNNEA